MSVYKTCGRVLKKQLMVLMFYCRFLGERSNLTFSLPQTVSVTTFSIRVSVWMTVPVDTLPTSGNRSVCVATLTVRRVMDRASMTVTCAVT